LTWILRSSPTFLKQRKKYAHTLYNERIRQAIRDLQGSSGPRKLGTFKRAAKYAAYYYEPDKSFRLVYNVLDDELVILLLDVGDHKQVYGND
jgi:mRNA-degrading endonuclease RelE of RelBE toxin-antitoxin system